MTKQQLPAWQSSAGGKAPLPQQSWATVQANFTGEQQLSIVPPQTPVQHSASRVQVAWLARQQRAGSPGAAASSTWHRLPGSQHVAAPWVQASPGAGQAAREAPHLAQA